MYLVLGPWKAFIVSPIPKNLKSAKSALVGRILMKYNNFICYFYDHLSDNNAYDFTMQKMEWYFGIMQTCWLVRIALIVSWATVSGSSTGSNLRKKYHRYVFFFFFFNIYVNYIDVVLLWFDSLEQRSLDKIRTHDGCFNSFTAVNLNKNSCYITSLKL